MTKVSNVLNSTANEVAAAPQGARARLGLAGLVAAGALAFALTPGLAAPAQAWADAAADEAVTTATEAGEDITLAERVAAQVVPSVGTVYVVADSGYGTSLCQGSGVVISADGYFITNYHVVSGAEEIQVVLGGAAYTAEYVGGAPTSDIAVLKIDPGDTELTPIEVGDSDDLRAGQWVMTVGTPQGESETVSAGIVSAVSRTTALDIDGTEAYFVGLIQTDAMINSGSSGGALVNADGELVGITTMSATTTGDWAGMTYAIPSNYAMGLAQQIIETGTVEYPQLGVSVVDLLDAYYSGYYSLKDASSVLGAYVASVVEGSGADEAGIQEGDLIVAADGQDVSGSDDLVIAVRGHAIGDTMTLTVERDGESIDVEVTLGSDGGTSATGEADEEDDEADEDEGWFGFGLGDQGGSQEGGQGGFGFGGQDEGQGGFGLLGGSDSHNNGSDSHGGSRSGSNGSSGRLGGFGAYTDSIGA